MKPETKERFSKCKQGVFKVLSQCMRETNASALFYGVLLVIENAQILYYLLHEQFTFLWPSRLMLVIQYGT